MSTAEVSRKLREILRPVLGHSGNVLYSSADTLKPCPIYLLGHNPGGSPEDQAEATVGASLAALPAKTSNSYFDEAWETASGRSWAPGDAPLQRRVAWLLDQLGYDARQVPCSNLLFVRSIDVARSSFSDMADLCWSAHELLLEIIQPKSLIVFGNSSPSPYSYLKEIWAPSAEEAIESGHGSWRCRRFRGTNGIWVVGLPHLSRYDVIGKGHVLGWIREVLAN